MNVFTPIKPYHIMDRPFRLLTVPVTRLLAPTMVTPNMVSLLRFYIYLGFYWVVAFYGFDFYRWRDIGFLLGCYLASILLDKVDGDLAVLQNRKTKTGRLLEALEGVWWASYALFGMLLVIKFKETAPGFFYLYAANAILFMLYLWMSVYKYRLRLEQLSAGTSSLQQNMEPAVESETRRLLKNMVEAFGWLGDYVFIAAALLCIPVQEHFQLNVYWVYFGYFVFNNLLLVASMLAMNCIAAYRHDRTKSQPGGGNVS